MPPGPWPPKRLMTSPLRPPIAPVGTEPTRLFIPAPVPWHKAPISDRDQTPAITGPVPPPILPVTPDPPKRKPAPVMLADVPAPVTAGMCARSLYGLGWHPRRIAQLLNNQYPLPAVSGLMHVCRSHWTAGAVKTLLLQTPNTGRIRRRVTYTTRG
jgi:hypothetical protein